MVEGRVEYGAKRGMNKLGLAAVHPGKLYGTEFAGLAHTCAAVLLALLSFSAITLAQEPEPDDSVTVSFVSQPASAQVSVDGKKNCVAPCKAVLFRGSHVIGMSLFGYFAHEELMDIQKDRKVSWKLEMEKGRLSVSSQPDGVSVVIRPKKGKGEREAKTPVNGMELAPGPYFVKITDDRFEPIEREVTVPPGDSAEVELEPRATMGTLSIRVVDEAGDPDTADLVVDGRKQKGSGPWPLKPGKHRVTAKKDGKVLLDQEVDVEAGDELDIDVTTGAEGP